MENKKKPKISKVPKVKVTTRQPPKPKKRFHCSVQGCGYSTFIFKDLARHMRKHTGEKPFACEQCDKRYSRHDKLVIHVRVHEGNRPFNCQICEYSTVDCTSLRKHERTHSGDRPYKCDQCNYAAKSSSQLIVHTRRHTGDNPYLCMVENCSAAFKTPSDLSRHVRFHTGQKPYKCLATNCNYAAAVKCNLTVHMKKHQQDKNANEECPEESLPTGRTQKCVVSDLVNGGQAMRYSPGTDLVGRQVSRTRRSRTSTPRETDYCCKICNYRAVRLKPFEAHMNRKHSNSQESSNTKHISIEGGTGNPISSGAKSFVCSTCSASFVQEKSLKCHERQHITQIPNYSKPTPPKHIVISVIKNNISVGNPILTNAKETQQHPPRPQVITFADSSYYSNLQT